MKEFSNSARATFVRISPNRTSPRKYPIDTVTIHCVEGQCTVEALGALFADPARRASSNYGIGSDGRIGLYVPESDRSWCSSSAANDHRAVTVEVASDAEPPYGVNAAAYDALILLLADICRRNGIPALRWLGDPSLVGQTEKQNMTVHRWFADTSCPGETLFSLHGRIAAAVNAALAPPAPGDTVAITPGSLYTNGVRVPDWVTAERWIVSSVNEKEKTAVIDRSASGEHAIRSEIGFPCLFVVAQALPAEPPSGAPGGQPGAPEPGTAELTVSVKKTENTLSLTFDRAQWEALFS